MNYLSFKKVESVVVAINEMGFISLAQNSSRYGEPQGIFLTLDQFRRIQRWVDKNEVEIDQTWNGGVEDETEA